MYKKLLNWLKANNTNQIIIILGVISMICYILMGTKLFGINAEFDNKYMLDLVFVYSKDTFFETLNNIPQVQIGFYQTTHYIDYVFILTFYPALIFIMTRVVSDKTSYLIWIPFFAMMFDLFEYLIIDIQLSVGVGNFLASICGIFTLLKFILILVTIIVIVYNFVLKRRKHGSTNI